MLKISNTIHDKKVDFIMSVLGCCTGQLNKPDIVACIGKFAYESLLTSLRKWFDNVDANNFRIVLNREHLHYDVNDVDVNYDCEILAVNSETYTFSEHNIKKRYKQSTYSIITTSSSKKQSMIVHAYDCTGYEIAAILFDCNLHDNIKMMTFKY